MEAHGLIQVLRALQTAIQKLGRYAVEADSPEIHSLLREIQLAHSRRFDALTGFFHWEQPAPAAPAPAPAVFASEIRIPKPIPSPAPGPMPGPTPATPMPSPGYAGVAAGNFETAVELSPEAGQRERQSRRERPLQPRRYEVEPANEGDRRRRRAPKGENR